LQKEIEVKSLAKADGIEEMQSYDHAFTPKNFAKQNMILMMKN
jgi:hypothetical protein